MPNAVRDARPRLWRGNRVADLEEPLDGEGDDSENGDPTCDRPGCFDPPRPGSRFCGGECEYAAGVAEDRRAP